MTYKQLIKQKLLEIKFYVLYMYRTSPHTTHCVVLKNSTIRGTMGSIWTRDYIDDIIEKNGPYIALKNLLVIIIMQFLTKSEKIGA